MNRVYQKHKDFKRKAVELVDERNRRLPFVLVQYVFEDGREHAISSGPHKNSKKAKGEFLQAKPTLLQKHKTEVKSRKSVAAIYGNAFEEVGSILNDVKTFCSTESMSPSVLQRDVQYWSLLCDSNHLTLLLIAEIHLFHYMK